MSIVIKPERDTDFYVGWSRIVEAPLWWGNRADAEAYLRKESPDDPAPRLARADTYGTSDMSVREGGWDDDGLIYEQRGLLPRRHLIEVCRLIAADNEAGVWDLLEPLEGETEVRRG